MSTRLEVASGLIVRLQAGEEAAFRAIYDQLHKQIYRLIFSLVKDSAKSEELLQEAFVALWLHRDKLNVAQPLYPFIYLTAKRLAIDHFRKMLSESEAKAYLVSHLNYQTNNTEEAVFLEELNKIAQQSINALPAQQQTVFILSREEGLSYDEIAQRLQISPNTVRNHMVCALKNLKLQFSKHGVIYLWLSLSLFA